MKRILLLISGITIFSISLCKAQSAGDFRSIGSSDWYTIANWETYNGAIWVAAVAFPTSANGVITIRSPHVVTVSLPVTVDQVVVANGATLTMSAGGYTFEVADGAGTDLTINGTLNLNGGGFVLGGLGTTVINNNANLAGTTVAAPITVANGGTLVLSASFTLDDVLTIQSGGTFNWTAGTLLFSDGTLSNSGTITVSNSGAEALNSLGGTNVFNNNAGGVFTKSSGGGTLDAAIPVNNAGTFNVNNASYRQIGNIFTNTGVINIGAGATFNNSTDLVLNSGTSLTGNGTLTLVGTTHTINLALIVPSGITTNLSAGTLLGTGSLTANGTVNWSGGTIDLPTTIASGATLVLSNGAVLDEVLTIQSGGTFNWTAGTLFFSDGTLSNSGTITVSNSVGASLNNFAGINVFNNNATGVFTKSSGGGTLDASIPVNNAGTFNVNNATYTQNGNIFTNTGVINIGAGATFNNSTDLVLNSGTSLTGNGTLTLAGTTHTINLALIVPSGITTNLSAGTLLGTGSLTANGTVNWSGGTIDLPTTIASGATLVLSNGAVLDEVLTIQSGGTFNWTAGTLFFSDGTLSNSGTITVSNSAAASLSNFSGVNVFNNNTSGVFTKSSGGGTLDASIPVNNAGTFNMNNASYTQNSNTFTNAGVINIGAGATFNNSAALVLNGGTSVTGSGTLTLAGVTHTINLALSIPSGITTNLNAGTLLGTGSLTANGTVNWSGTLIDLPTTIASGATLVLSSSSTLDEVLTIQSGGAFNWTGGNFGFSDGTLSNSGTITVSNSSAAGLFNDAGINVFNNNLGGVFTKSSGGGTLNATIPVNNAGAFNVNNASYSQDANTFSNAGGLNIGVGATFNSSGALVLNSGTSLTGSGTLTLAGVTHTINLLLSVPSGITTNLSAGTLLGTGSLTANGTVNWSGTTIDIPVTIASGATLALNNTSILDNILTIASGGTFNWTAGTFNFSDGTLNNSGIINVNNAAAVSMDNYFNINNIFNNNVTGRFRKSGGAGIVTVAIPLTNTGTIGGIGTIDITGTLANSGIVAPGLSTGILTLNSTNPLFSGSGSLNIEMQDGSGPGTGHDQLVRAGNLALGGMTLNVTQPGIVPLGNYTIVNLSSGTITGTFSPVNLPGGYVVSYTATTVVLTKATLPVVLTNFTALRQGNSVMLNWKTASEQNTGHFEIQRSRDGIVFEPIGQVQAAGNSNILREYSFSDMSPLSKSNYYRLKQVDLDGKAHLSSVVRINFDRNLMVKMLPNPANQFIRFEGAERFTHFNIIDINGKRINHILLSPSQREFSISNLMPGVYTIQLMNGDEMQQFKLIKL